MKTIFSYPYFNRSNKTFTATYALQVLPFAKPPYGYTPGTVIVNIKSEVKQYAMNKIIFTLALFIFTTLTVNAQKESFDIVSYTPPQGWNKDSKDDYVSYSRIDGASWSQIAVYKSRQSSGSLEDDAQKDWEDIVLKLHAVEQEEKTDPTSAEGWQVMSRSGVWQYNGANVATLLTTYSNGKQYVSVLWNGTAQPYMQNLKDFIASLDLDASAVQADQNAMNNNEQNSSKQTTGISNNDGSSTSPSTGKASSVVGLWLDYKGEETGFVNGFRTYSGGYFRKEYLFKEDNTYIFRQKNWVAAAKTIYFVYETGTWSMKSNQLTVIPKSNKAGWWNKDGNWTDRWGSYKEAAKYKTETVAYTFEITEDNYGTYLKLKSGKATERDGGKFNSPPYEFHYRFDKGKSLIDNPPGFKL